MDVLRDFVKKHKDILSYLFFGGLTTIVSFVVYFLLHRWGQLSATISNIVAWICAVLFAFVTNKPFVFQSHDWSKVVMIPEFTKFVGSRIFSGLFETGMLALTVDFWQFHDLTMKIIASVIVVILNYVASKLLVFRSTRKTK